MLLVPTDEMGCHLTQPGNLGCSGAGEKTMKANGWTSWQMTDIKKGNIIFIHSFIRASFVSEVFYHNFNKNKQKKVNFVRFLLSRPFYREVVCASGKKI